MSVLQIAILIHVVGFIIHIGFFRFFENFYKYIKDRVGVIPTAWCFLWPICWFGLIIYYIVEGIIKGTQLIYYSVEYIVSGQWNYE